MPRRKRRYFTPEREELQRLRRENRELRLERGLEELGSLAVATDAKRRAP